MFTRALEYPSQFSVLQRGRRGWLAGAEIPGVYTGDARHIVIRTVPAKRPTKNLSIVDSACFEEFYHRRCGRDPLSERQVDRKPER